MLWKLRHSAKWRITTVFNLFLGWMIAWFILLPSVCVTLSQNSAFPGLKLDTVWLGLGKYVFCCQLSVLEPQISTLCSFFLFFFSFSVSRLKIEKEQKKNILPMEMVFYVNKIIIFMVKKSLLRNLWVLTFLD